MALQNFAKPLQSTDAPPHEWNILERIEVTSVTPVTVATFTMDPDTVAMVRYRVLGRDVSLTYRSSEHAIKIFERIGGIAPTTVSTNQLITKVHTAGEISFTTDGNGLVSAIYTADSGPVTPSGTVYLVVDMEILKA